MSGTINTKIEVFNAALDLVREPPIQTLEDSAARPPARWIERNFRTVIDATTAANPWNHARARALLNEDLTAPAFEWDYRYQLPGECLRVLPLTENGERTGSLVPFEIENGFLLTDQSGPLRVRYIRHHLDYSQWPPLFVQLVAVNFAYGLVRRFDAKSALVKDITEMRSELQDAASQIDFVEGTVPQHDEFDILTVRRG